MIPFKRKNKINGMRGNKNLVPWEFGHNNKITEIITVNIMKCKFCFQVVNIPIKERKIKGRKKRDFI